VLAVAVICVFVVKNMKLSGLPEILLHCVPFKFEVAEQNSMGLRYHHLLHKSPD
jgi:hypothetical protein